MPQPRPYLTPFRDEDGIPILEFDEVVCEGQPGKVFLGDDGEWEVRGAVDAVPLTGARVKINHSESVDVFLARREQHIAWGWFGALCGH
jgi:hypothetical protein